MLIRRQLMNGQEDAEVKEWRLIYDGNIDTATSLINIETDSQGIPLSDLDLTEWICEMTPVVDKTGQLLVNGLNMRMSMPSENTNADTARPVRIHYTKNPFGAECRAQMVNGNSIIKSDTDMVNALYSNFSNVINNITFSNSTHLAEFTTDTILKICGR